ncbi:PLP-dependent aminotransferase family protein [Pseudoxanthomonas sangjuensis]|uniref:MocR-like pyridoxine biosynthesis transcription factor PdxR n=1 Tax=Pseudoxanthomonas sangjuensis TaxID=1503750 RepID=UPI001391C23F|nr:PLP-dependent aminotransferase family protein [Pseudoxanthomonas sangjuensis]KAF1713211.1 GntR family transcriptional regulator [Pseudoxanthomonas sangjuensis]
MSPDSSNLREPVFAIPFDLPGIGEGQRTAALHRQLRDAIIDGRLAAGERLPSSRRAAEALGVARKTVVAAYDLLIAEGYVLPRPGARAAVADIAARRASRTGPLEARARSELIAPAWRTPPPRHAQAVPLPERSFRTGVPEHRFFPHDAWRRLSARAWRQWSKRPFGYPPVEGVPALREAIAQHVAFSRAVACNGDEVVVTSGAQNAFDLLARLLVEPGRTRVAVESPGYPTLRQAFAAAGALVVPVPVDDEGLRVDLLPKDVRVVCVTPSHQSPTGVALSMRRRAALLAHAREHDAVIVEDDYDGEFRYSGRPLDALQTLDRDARVFYVGTFSKSLFPAIDTGFVVAPAWARASLAAVKRMGDSHAPGPLQETLAAFIREGHLARHVRRMTPIYAQRREVLLEALEGGLRRWFAPIPSIAGLHLAARIDPAADARAVFDALRRHAPGAQTAAEYSLQADALQAAVFGYAVIDADDIREALARLARALSR